MNISGKGILCYALVLISFIASGCNDIEVTGKWKETEIKIDGINSEWQNSTFIKDANAYINIVNDNDYLYLAIMSSDRQLPMKIMRDGLTVWFDPSGKQEKDFGVHFPLRMNPSEIPETEFMKDMGKHPEENPAGPQYNEFEIVNSENETEAVVLFGKNSGIEIKMSKPSERFLYEMKVPLKITAEEPYAISADTGATISIGFETPQNDLDKMRDGMPDKKMGPPPENDGENGMAPGRGKGKMPPGGAPKDKSELEKPFKLWINVKLASGR